MQHLARLFFETLTSHPTWKVAEEKRLLSVPLCDGWESRPFFTHIITIWTRSNHIYWLYFHLLSSGYCVWPIDYPTVPVGQSRIKISLHARNTEAEIKNFLNATFQWVDEILAIGEGAEKEKPSRAAEQVYAWMRREGLQGFGLDK